MRTAFIRALTDLAERDQRILLLTGDLGFMVLEGFSGRFPGRFFNAGVAEQNMAGVSTGLAEAGYIPFLYSIATFASLRGYEFIRNGPLAHRLPVRILGIGQGFEYGQNGLTHYGFEDIALMRTQPGMTVISPTDDAEAKAALLATWDLPGPVYYRLSKNERRLPGVSGRFTLGHAETIRRGTDVLIISTGAITKNAIQAADFLERKGIKATLMTVASLSPAPSDDLAMALSMHGLAVTIEAHYTVGGLGSLVAEVIADRGIDCRLLRRGVDRSAQGKTGGEDYLASFYGLSGEALSDTIHKELSGKSK